nr:translesion DNA synthesis-associated protein ImuA [Cupriavidus sp. AU9028]
MPEAASRARRERDSALAELEQRHPGLWRAGQLGRTATVPVWSTGHAALDAELPGGGWPLGAVTELLHADCGIGELRLVRPTLQSLTAAGRRVAMIGPPCPPNAIALTAWGLPPHLLYWIRTDQQKAQRPARPAARRAHGNRAAARLDAPDADMVWAAEQVLRSQAFGAVLVWLPSARPEAVRRLQVLAQASESVVWLWRPATALRESSPAVLRLLLAPQPGNALSIVFHKRRGPVRDTPLLLTLDAMPAVPSGRSLPAQPHRDARPHPETEARSDHAVLDRGAFAAPATGRAATQLA